MSRVWDYIGFAVWFAGLGYIVMWLLRSPDLCCCRRPCMCSD